MKLTDDWFDDFTMKAETATFTQTVAIADADGVPIRVGSGLAVAPGSAFWPCPNHCERWCRTDIKFRDGKPEPMTNHHPRCEHVDASLMDVWSVRIPGEEHGCVTHCEADAHAMALEDPDAPLEVVKIKMHREIYEHLGEFNGF